MSCGAQAVVMLPADQRAQLERRFAFYRVLDPERRVRFDGQVEAFMARRRFVSDGDPVDDRTRLFIAALACRMTVDMPAEELRRLEVVNVVDALVSRTGDRLAGHAAGSVVSEVTFTRKALEQAFREDDDGRNVVYHELAHVLDSADGISDGIPPLLLHPNERERWRTVMSRELDHLRAAVALGIPTALDPYGKTDEVELFAVATEAFFERPSKLRNAHPELYELLAAFYHQRPESR